MAWRRIFALRPRYPTPTIVYLSVIVDTVLLVLPWQQLTSSDMSIRLSKNDWEYLKRNPRRFKMTRTEVLAEFERHGIPALKLFVDFQLNYGGYCPVVEEMTFGIVSPLNDGDDRHWAETIDGVVRVEITVDCCVQTAFWMNENGIISCGGSPVAESFESHIRHENYLDSNLDDSWRSIGGQFETKKIQKLLSSQKLHTVEHASDSYRIVQRNDGVIVVKAGHYVDLFVKPELFYPNARKRR